MAQQFRDEFGRFQTNVTDQKGLIDDRIATFNQDIGSANQQINHNDFERARASYATAQENLTRAQDRLNDHLEQQVTRANDRLVELEAQQPPLDAVLLAELAGVRDALTRMQTETQQNIGQATQALAATQDRLDAVVIGAPGDEDEEWDETEEEVNEIAQPAPQQPAPQQRAPQPGLGAGQLVVPPPAQPVANQFSDERIDALRQYYEAKGHAMSVHDANTIIVTVEPGDTYVKKASGKMSTTRITDTVIKAMIEDYFHENPDAVTIPVKHNNQDVRQQVERVLAECNPQARIEIVQPEQPNQRGPGNPPVANM